MRIGVDLTHLQTATAFHGIGNYSFHFLSYLQHHPNVQLLQFQPQISNLSREAYIHELSRFILDNRVEFFHIQSPMQVEYSDVIEQRLIPPVRLSALVYDLIPAVYPKQYLPSPENVEKYERQLAMLRSFDVLLTISDFTRDDVIRHDFAPERVTSIGFGCDESFYKLDSVNLQSLTTLFPIDQPYILAFTTGEYRKNGARLIQSFARAIHATRSDCHLVIINSAKTADMSAVLQAEGIEERTHFIGRIDKSQLLNLYNGALGVAFPSMYEGIGLPALEAMQCGTPVLCSNNSSLPEVVGDDAVLVNPHDGQSITDGLTSLLSNEKLRNKLAQRGPDRANLFQWESVVNRAMEAFEHSIEERPMNISEAQANYELKQLLQSMKDDLNVIRDRMPTAEYEQTMQQLRDRLEKLSRRRRGAANRAKSGLRGSGNRRKRRFAAQLRRKKGAGRRSGVRRGKAKKTPRGRLFSRRKASNQPIKRLNRGASRKGRARRKLRRRR